MTSSPAACSALALASTASVADSAMAARRARHDAVGYGSLSASCHAGTVTAHDPTDLTHPADLLPADGRFGCGPSKVRPEQLDAVVAAGDVRARTSHRQAPVKHVVGSVRAGLAELFGLPDGWEIVLGNGGTTVFWDVATFGLVEQRSEHLVFGEFSSKFAEAVRRAPHLDDPVVVAASPATIRPRADGTLTSTP